MKWKFSFSFCAVYLRETVSRMKKKNKKKKQVGQDLILFHQYLINGSLRLLTAAILWNI